MDLQHHRAITVTLILFAVCCCTSFSLADDSQDQALKAAADLSAAVASSRRSYGAGPSYASSYVGNNQYQPVPVPVPTYGPVSTSYGYDQQPAQVVYPHKAPKAKGWAKNIFKSSNKGATSAYPSYVLPPLSYGSSYTSQYGAAGASPYYAKRYGDYYPNGYNNNGYSSGGSYGSASYAPPAITPYYGSSYNNVPSAGPYQSPSFIAGGVGGLFGPGRFPLQPPLVGSSLYGSPAYGSFYGLNFAGIGGNILGGGSAYGGYQQSYNTPTLFGAFDNYRGPISYGGFRPTLGPYGGKPFSDLLSVTDSYGRPLFPYPSIGDLYSKRSDS